MPKIFCKHCYSRHVFRDFDTFEECIEHETKCNSISYLKCILKDVKKTLPPFAEELIHESDMLYNSVVVEDRSWIFQNFTPSFVNKLDPIMIRLTFRPPNLKELIDKMAKEYENHVHFLFDEQNLVLRVCIDK